MKVNRDRFKSWPVTAVVLGLAALAALGVAYWSNVQDRERYLQSRNFRLLSDLASQTANLIENRARIFRDTIGDPRVQAPASWKEGAESWQDEAASLLRTEGLADDLARAVIVWPRGSTVPASSPQLKEYRLAVKGEGSSLLINWVPPSESQAPFSMRVPAAAALANTFTQKLRLGAFDTLVLATPAGQVVYAVGRRAAEMQATSVAAVLPVPSGRERPDFNRFAETISEQRVQIAGVEYRMFAQPCCRSDAPEVQAGSARSTGFMVIGLTETEAMRVASWAISPVLVLSGVALVMAALVGWPFLKCALMGAQQRITRRDVISLGTSSLFGLALATILLLSVAAYARLTADVTAQLADLAGDISREFETEIRRASNQMRAMTDRLRDESCVSLRAVRDARTRIDRLADPCWAITGPWSRKVDLPDVTDGYDHFKGFSLVDADGFQRVKAAGVAASQRQVLVVERDYFQQAVTQRGLWRIDGTCPDGCVLESHWSWTTGQPQVVLARSTGIAALPVATLAIPMRSVIEPVLPPGFEFAIVDQEGKVQFHSDTQRNVHENLFLETDRNPRLQSLIFAHSEGALSTSYWGRPYRAFVKPTVIPGWSIVTLHDKQLTRPLVLEWTTAALSMQALYTVGWILAMLLVIWRGGSWLWPDPRRRPWYGSIAMVCMLALGVWAVVAARYEPITIALVGVAVPIAVWLVTYLLLATRPPGVDEVKAWSEMCRDYRFAGALLLVVSAMVPAASFFALSHDLHVEAHTKQLQIALAQAVDRMEPCSDTDARKPGFPQLVRYDKVFYKSDPECTSSSITLQQRDNPLRDFIHEKVEDLLPYYTSASIALRELMHYHAGDGTWSSDRREPGRLSVIVKAREPKFHLSLGSPLPAFFGVRALQKNAPVWMTMIALALLPGVGLAGFGIVSYLLRRVALADVVEPARPNEKVDTKVGQHVLLLHDAPAEKADRLADAYVLPLTPIVSSSHTSAAWRRARESVSEVAPIQRVAIPDVDDRPEDVGLMRRRLALIEELMGEPDQTVILLSKQDAAVLIERARAASKWDADPERGPKMLTRFTVVEQRKSKQAEDGPPVVSTPASWWRDLKRVVAALCAELLKRWRSLGTEHNWRDDLIASECNSHPALGRICAALRGTPAFTDASLTRDQILEEFEDRAAPFYRRIWGACDSDERVVLEHVARHGLATAASRRIVRRLLARGLLRKDPALRLMNQSFARFVLEAERTREVAVLEQQAEPSVWDRVRVPLAVAAVLAVAFLVATQREAFDATLSMAVGVSAAVPTLVKLTNLLTQLGSRATGEPKANA
jgi:hypothetical protein